MQYVFSWDTSKNHKYASGALSGYEFTVIGENGNTAPHDCIGNREEGESGSCVFEDAAGRELIYNYIHTMRNLLVSYFAAQLVCYGDINM